MFHLNNLTYCHFWKWIMWGTKPIFNMELKSQYLFIYKTIILIPVSHLLGFYGDRNRYRTVNAPEDVVLGRSQNMLDVSITGIIRVTTRLILEPRWIQPPFWPFIGCDPTLLHFLSWICCLDYQAQSIIVASWLCSGRGEITKYILLWPWGEQLNDYHTEGKPPSCSHLPVRHPCP